MFQLDDEFLDSVGLSELPAPEKLSLLRRVYEELELRVGAQISDELSEAQLQEFEAIIDRDHERIVSWLELNAPDFPNDPVYQKIAQSSAVDGEAEVVCDYVATKWLEVNSPNYKALVQKVFGELETELRCEAERLLGKV